MNKNKILKVSIVMGSQSDYKIMKLCEKTLKNLGILFETKIISAHRTPKRMYEYALNTEKNNVGVIIAGCRRICTLTWNDCSFNIITSFRGAY
jgi:5-(carboxyamino)imidazole ribonucleotide mutase